MVNQEEIYTLQWYDRFVILTKHLNQVFTCMIELDPEQNISGGSDKGTKSTNQKLSHTNQAAGNQ